MYGVRLTAAKTAITCSLVGKLSYSYRSMTRDYCFLFCSISSNSHGLLQELLRKKKTLNILSHNYEIFATTEKI